jgi:hypothetical protein
MAWIFTHLNTFIRLDMDWLFFESSGGESRSLGDDNFAGTIHQALATRTEPCKSPMMNVQRQSGSLLQE